MKKLYIQYGCGLSAPKDWVNYDASPSLRLQKIPGIGILFRKAMAVKFPINVKYGDIVKGLPLEKDSVDAVYCSHVLEHLALNDFRTAIQNTYKVMKSGAVFRCVVPDLESIANTYLNGLSQGDGKASIDFIGKNSLLGTIERPHGLRQFIISLYGNSRHLWMWDYYSLSEELAKAGFRNIHRAYFNDSMEKAFKSVEDKDRFENAVAIECIK